MKEVKKVFRFFFSMRFALIVLAALLLFCVAGSLISQGETESYYTENYPSSVGYLILLLNLDDAFHSVIFMVLAALLCINLLGCNVIHLPVLIRRMKEGFHAERMPGWNPETVTEPVCTVTDAEKLFREAGFRRGIAQGETPDGHAYRYAVRNKAGIWGAWLTHLGLLVIILGFTLGQIGTVKYTVYGVPGQTLAIGDTGYAVTINDFSIGKREDDTVEQYTANITVTDLETGETGSGEASVNHPLSLFHMKFYQNSTGYAARCLIFEGDELIQDEILCAGEYVAVQDLPELIIYFRAFYPDYYLSENGVPSTASSDMNNPGYFYQVFYQGSTIGMNVLTDEDYITIDDYTVVFTEPQNYTLLQIKHDPYAGITLAGGVIMCVALILAFYTLTQEILAVEIEPNLWHIYIRSKKGELMLTEKLKDIAEHLRPEEDPNGKSAEN